MVKQLAPVFCGIFFALCLTPTWSAQLNVNLDKARTPLGEPIQLRITAPLALNDLDLTPLQNDFEIFSRAASFSTTQGKSLGVLDATLYPLRSGRLNLPVLRLGNSSSRAQTVEVTPSTINPSAWLEPVAPMEREAATLVLQFQDEGDLSFTPPQLDAPHIAWSALPDISALENSGENSGKRQLRWRILPLQNGSLTINFPMLDAYRFGQRLRFPLGALNFRATRAPAYLPLYLPVGQPKISADPLATSLIVGRPYNRNIYIDAPGLSPDGALKVLHYNAAPGLVFYAPSAMRIKREGRELIQISLNFYASSSAPIFPALHLSYFDPTKQMVQSLALPSVRLTARNPALTKQLIAVAIAVATLLLVAAGDAARPRVRAWYARRRWIKALSASTDATQLYQVLTRQAPWSAPTLRRWPPLLAKNIMPQLQEELEALRFRAGLLEGSTLGPAQSSSAARQAPQPKQFIALREEWKTAAANLALKFFV